MSDHHCPTCNGRDCEGAPRFKGICPNGSMNIDLKGHLMSVDLDAKAVTIRCNVTEDVARLLSVLLLERDVLRITGTLPAKKR